MVNRSKTWAVALLMAAFVVGAVVGGGGEAAGARQAHAADPGRGRGLERMKANLDRELGLTGGQRDSVHAVLDRHWTRMTAAWETVRPRFDSMRAQMDSDVARQLSAEQQARYRDHVARYRHHTEKTDSGGKNGWRRGRADAVQPR